MENQEEWRPVLGFEKLYEVSDHGRVRSKARTIIASNNIMRTLPGRPKKLTPDDRGYLSTMLYKGNVGHRKYAHRLVLEAFVEECPEGMQTCHNDGDPANNHVSNLRWGTPSENNLDQVKHGTHNNGGKTHCKRGHPLKAPNLTTFDTKRGQRGCRACSAARSMVYRNPDMEHRIQRISDLKYAEFVRADSEQNK